MESPHDARFWLDADTEEPEQVPFAGGLAVVTSRPCPERDRGNEDGAALIPFDAQSGAIAVADGVGGQPAGAHAAERALFALRDALAEAAREGEPIRSAILNGFERANHALIDAGLGAATTLAVASVEEGALRSFHAGDSAVLVTGQRGRLKLQTVAHSPVGYAVEAGFLDEREALHHAQRHVISNAIGADDMRIEIGSLLPLAPRDTVIVSSDGLLDNLATSETIALVRKGPLLGATSALTDACRQRMTTPRSGQPSKPDDLTLITFRSKS